MTETDTQDGMVKITLAAETADCAGPSPYAIRLIAATDALGVSDE